MSHFQDLCRNMGGLLQSATKYCLMVCVTVLALAYMGIVFFNIHDSQIILGVKESFGSIALLIVGFYFGKQVPVPPQPNTITTTASTETVPVAMLTPSPSQPNETLQE